MNRIWLKTSVLGLLCVVLLSGCLARPAPRREAPGTIDSALSTRVTETARQVTGAGRAEAIVLGNRALVAIQLDNLQPGGTAGLPLTGLTNDPDYPGTSTGGGPTTIQGPGGSPGMSPAMPGGGVSPGGATTGGGTPNSTQAVPNAAGQQDTLTPSGTAPAPGASWGSAPLDVMNRIANKIKSDHTQIAEVRFATSPDDARRVADIAAAMKATGRADAHVAEVDRLLTAGAPAGLTPMSPQHPPQGTYPTR